MIIEISFQLPSSALASSRANAVWNVLIKCTIYERTSERNVVKKSTLKAALRTLRELFSIHFYSRRHLFPFLPLLSSNYLWNLVREVRRLLQLWTMCRLLVLWSGINRSLANKKWKKWKRKNENALQMYQSRVRQETWHAINSNLMSN